MKAWRICTLGATEIFVHPALILYLLYAWLTGHGLFVCLALLSITLHEAAHAGISALFGQKPSNVELTPLGAVMRLEDENRLPPFRRLLMLLAGPVMTLVLCSTAILLGKRSPGLLMNARYLFMCNLSILLLNLLPVLPLDGGRILALLLSAIMPFRSVYRLLRWLGTLIGLALIGLNVYASWALGGWNLSMAFAGCCILYASARATTTRMQAELRQFMDRKIMLERKGSCPMVFRAVLHHVPLHRVLSRLPSGRLVCFLCLEAGTVKPLGWMTEAEVIQQYLQHAEWTMKEALTDRTKSKNAAKTSTECTVTPAKCIDNQASFII